MPIINPLAPAEFSPTWKGFSGQGAFRYWAQTVLPAVYDDSLSYQELLAKVVQILNIAIEDVENAGDDVTVLRDAYEQLESYVNKYFNEVDVQQEINNKLDALVEDGTLNQQMEPYLSEYAEEVARLTTAVNETRTTLESDYTTTNNRISNIIAANNSTTENSELIDIRTDWKGTVHNSAGDAIRNQTRSALHTEYINSTTIESNSDLNNFTTPGNYKINSVSTAQTISNKPITSSGRLTVLSTSSNTQKIQVFVANTEPDNKIFVRFIHNENFLPWFQVLTTPSTSNEYIPSNYANAIVIPANSDLNNYLNYGNYVIASATTATSINNIPKITSGRLIVFTTSSATQAIQIFIANTEPLPEIYMRILHNGNFFEWSKIITNNNTDSYITTNNIIDNTITKEKLSITNILDDYSAEDIYLNYQSINWELGGFNKTNGANIDLDGAIRSIPFPCIAGTVFSVDEDNKLCIGGAEYQPEGPANQANLITIRGAGDSANRLSYVVQNNCLLKLIIYDADRAELTDPMELAKTLKIYTPKADIIKFNTIDPHAETILDPATCFIEKMSLVATTGVCNLYPQGRAAIINIDPSTTYTISKATGLRFRVATFDNYPQPNDVGTNQVTADKLLSCRITSGENDHWLMIYFWYSAVDTAVTAENALRSITVSVGHPNAIASTVTAYDSVARESLKSVIEREYGTPTTFIHDPVIEERDIIDTLGIDKSGIYNTVHPYVTTDKMYELWDGLVTRHPHLVDQPIVIGNSIDEKGNIYRPIRAYRVHPREAVGSTDQYKILYDPNTPTYFINCLTHGRERQAAYNIYQIFKRMLDGDTVYSHLLQDAVYWVIPVLCCWGCDHGNRYLAESLNSGENESTDPNRLTSIPLNIPSYAPEVQAIIDFVENQNIGANPNNVFMDIHNCNAIYGYLASDKPRDKYLFDSMMVKLAHSWRCRSVDGNREPSSYYGDSDLEIGNLKRNISVPGIENSIAWYIGQTYNIRTSVIHETIGADTMEDGNNKSGSYYFTGFSVSKAMDMLYGFLNEIWKDNQIRLAIASVNS